MVLDNTGRGGAQAYAMNVQRNIDRSVFRIDFAVNRTPLNGYQEEILSLGSRILHIPKFKVFNWYTYSKAWNRLLEENDFDIVHGHVSSTAAIYLHIARKKNCVTIVHSHSAGYRGNCFARSIKKIFTKYAKREADYWFSCSEKAAFRLFGYDYLNYPNYVEIPNAIIVEKYKFDRNTRQILRSRMGVAEDTLLVGHVGSFSTPKNHPFLLRIFKSIKVRRTNVKFVLIGAGKLEMEIKDMVQRLGLSKEIIFTGSIGNVNEYMMALDVMVFPSLFEGFPVTIIEAQAAGLYTVFSDTITTQVNLTDFVVPMSLEDNESVWAEKALQKKMYDRRLGNEIIAKSEFNMKTSIKTLERLYMKMVKK